ncbi:MAG: response regulator transcription factor [Bacteroidetes bacterium]|nr:response regulator transcription factor [Bacteroidota bacterium]
MKQLISQVEFLVLKKECSDPMEAFNYLKTEDVDLVFLDIEMPGMSGIELLKNLEKHPLIIFITANKEYALEAFELNVADYILKPINLSRFMAAVSRAKELFDNKEQKFELNQNDKDYIFVRSNSQLVKIKINDILYVQALGDYVNIFTSTARNTVHITLKALEEKLPAKKFYRLHRSYLIAIDHIDRVEEGTAFIDKHPIPIGEQFKKELLKKLNLI